ncbi:hypothetical protein [Novosphingobium marinum]|nr:hypothetical protein [Novosphingobium marinum]
MPTFAKYLGLLLNRASQKSVLLTDRLTIMIVPFTTLALWMTGAKMTDSIQETVFVGVAITVLVVVLLRLAAASYFVWKDDQGVKSELRTQLDEPERMGFIAMQEFTRERRKDLSDSLGRLAAIATQTPTMREGMGVNNLYKAFADVDALISQLSYDIPVRISAIRLRNLCAEMLSGTRHEDELFWRQRKITFRIIHKEDLVNDIFSLLELEILLEDMGVKPLTESPARESPIEEVKGALRSLGDTYYDPQVQKQLRETLASIKARDALR